MNGPPLTVSEIRQILVRSVDRHLALGLDRSAAIAATAREFGATEYKVAALVESTQRRPGSPLSLSRPSNANPAVARLRPLRARKQDGARYLRTRK